MAKSEQMGPETHKILVWSGVKTHDDPNGETVLAEIDGKFGGVGWTEREAILMALEEKRGGEATNA